MKTISLLLVMIGVCLAKPPSLFPDFLAPFRGIFGSSRGGESGASGDKSYPHYHQHLDATGAETGRPYRGDASHDSSFRPFHPTIPNYAQYDNFVNYASDVQPQLQQERKPSQLYHAEGRPQPQFAPQQGRPPPNFYQGKPIPIRQNRQIYQPQSQIQQAPQHLRLSVISQFQPPPIHHSQPRPSDFSEYQHHSDPSEYSDYQTVLHQQPQPSGFSGFSLNPPEFGNGNDGGEIRSPHDDSAFTNQGYDNKHQGQEDVGENPYQPDGGSHLIGLTDPQNDDGSGNAYDGSNKVVILDQVPRHPSEMHSSNYVAQGPPMRSSPGTFRPSMPFHSMRVKQTPAYGESQGKKRYLNPPPIPTVPQRPGKVPDKQMLMSGSSSNPQVIVRPNGRKRLRKVPMLVTSPAFQPPKGNFEPVAAASSYRRSEGRVEGNDVGDRVLYHLAGHQGPYSYRFGYDTGKGYNRMFRHEEKDGKGLVKGNYGFHDKDGKLHVVNYTAHPKGGFHAERARSH